MIYLDYYLVDVGENYCYVFPCSMPLDIRKAYKENNIVDLKLIREVLTHRIRENLPFFHEEKNVIVFVNKEDKLWVRTETFSKDSGEREEPLVSDEQKDIHVIYPGQRVDIECQVYPFEVENRSINYDYFMELKKKHRGRRKRR